MQAACCGGYQFGELCGDCPKAVNGSRAEGDTLPEPSLPRWLVTRVETVTVAASTEERALYLGEAMLGDGFAETTNTEVERVH